MVKRRAVVVGMGKYQDPRISPLKYALSDASKINGLLEHLPDGEFEVRQILNGSAQDVFEALEWAVEGLSGGDLFFFYFAGHGVQQEFSGQHLLLCNDARSKTFGSNHSLGVVPHSYLKDIAHDLPCDCLFCFDACRTPVYKGMREAMAVMEGSRAFRDIVTANNSVIGGVCWTIWSCADRQQAEERPDIGGGIFTISLIKTLRQRIKDLKGIVIDEDLMRSVVDQMKKYSDGMTQTPCHSACPSGIPLTILPGSEEFGESAIPPKPPGSHLKKERYWWYDDDKEIKETEFIELIKSGRVPRETLVWKVGFSEWIQAYKCAELKEAFPKKSLKKNGKGKNKSSLDSNIIIIPDFITELNEIGRNKEPRETLQLHTPPAKLKLSEELINIHEKTSIQADFSLEEEPEDSLSDIEKLRNEASARRKKLLEKHSSGGAFSPHKLEDISSNKQENASNKKRGGKKQVELKRPDKIEGLTNAPQKKEKSYRKEYENNFVSGNVSASFPVKKFLICLFISAVILVIIFTPHSYCIKFFTSAIGPPVSPGFNEWLMGFLMLSFGGIGIFMLIRDIFIPDERSNIYWRLLNIFLIVFTLRLGLYTAMGWAGSCGPTKNVKKSQNAVHDK